MGDLLLLSVIGSLVAASAYSIESPDHGIMLLLKIGRKKLELMKIKSDLSELLFEKNQRNGVCKIWFEEGEFYFPESNWVDFSYLLLPDWTRVIIELTTTNSKEGILSFVDGRFAVRLIRIQEDEFQASFGVWDPFDTIFEETTNFKTKLNITDLASEIVNLNSEVIRTSKENHIESEYLTTLIIWNDKMNQLLHSKNE